MIKKRMLAGKHPGQLRYCGYPLTNVQCPIPQLVINAPLLFENPFISLSDVDVSYFNLSND